MTTKEQSLEGLIERVKAATGPDRELDCRIAYAVDFGVDGMGNSFRSYCDVHDLNWAEIARHANSHQSILSHNLPRFTASIDAALALVERVLPGWVVSDLSQNSRHAGDPWGCTLALYFGSTPSKNRSASSGYDYPKPSLAIIAALLQALKETSNDHE